MDEGRRGGGEGRRGGGEVEEVQVCPSEKLREAGTSSAVDETGDELLLGYRDNDVDDNDDDGEIDEGDGNLE